MATSGVRVDSYKCGAVVRSAGVQVLAVDVLMSVAVV